MKNLKTKLRKSKPPQILRGRQIIYYVCQWNLTSEKHGHVLEINTIWACKYRNDGGLRDFQTRWIHIYYNLREGAIIDWCQIAEYYSN